MSRYIVVGSVALQDATDEQQWTKKVFVQDQEIDPEAVTSESLQGAIEQGLVAVVDDATAEAAVARYEEEYAKREASWGMGAVGAGGGSLVTSDA